MKVVKVAALVFVCSIFLTACGYEYTTKWAPSEIVADMVAQMGHRGWELVSETELPLSDPASCCSSTGPYHELVFRKRKTRLIDRVLP